MCSAIIITGGRFAAGIVAISVSTADRNTPKARSPAARRFGSLSTGMPASNMAE